MRATLNAAIIYLLAGLGSGLFYRELTKLQQFPEGQFTQLAVAHTHLLTLGFLVLLVVLLLDKVFSLSGTRLFTWFFWLYNAGLVLTAGTLIWHGSLTVLGEESTTMIAGIAGLGHMLLTAALVLLVIRLYRAVTAQTPTTRPAVTVAP